MEKEKIPQKLIELVAGVVQFIDSADADLAQALSIKKNNDEVTDEGTTNATV